MRRFLIKLHRWIGLLIGVQVLLWLLSGLMISLLDPVKVSGEQWASIIKHEPRVIDSASLLELTELPVELLEGTVGIELTMRNGEPFYLFKSAASETLVNAMDGSIVLTGKTDAERLARQDFSGDGEIISSEPGMAPDMETRGNSGAYWRVNFSDRANTAIYLSASTGRILERRNSYWRIRDFFWMLHIMDYSGRENFNNFLVIAIALIAIWLGISGFLLLFSSFSRFDFFFLNILGKRDEATITLIDPGASNQRQVKLRKGSNLFLSLATHDVNIASICGGGGECGKCRVRLETTGLPEANDIEIGLIPKRLREQGYRLACQQKVEYDTALHLDEGTLVHGQ